MQNNEQLLSKLMLRNMLMCSFLFLVLIPLVLAVLVMSRALISPFVTGILFAYLFFPFVSRFERIGVPRIITILVLILAILGLVTSLVSIVAPTIQGEIKLLRKAEMPQTTVSYSIQESGESDMNEMVVKSEVSESEVSNDDIADHEEHLGLQTLADSNLIKLILDIGEQLKSMGIVEESWSSEQVYRFIVSKIVEYRRFIFEGISGFALKSGQFLMICIFTFIFVLLDGDKIPRTIISLLPNSFFETGIFMMHKTSEMFSSYLRGVFFETLILFSISFLCFLPICVIFPLSFIQAFTIAMIFACTNVVRIVGPIFGALVGAVIVLTTSGDLYTMLMVFIVAAFVQVLDNVAVLPLIMKDQVKIHPVICLLGVLAGGKIGNIIGMIVAIPVIGGIQIIYRILAIEMRRFKAR